LSSSIICSSSCGFPKKRLKFPGTGHYQRGESEIVEVFSNPAIFSFSVIAWHQRIGFHVLFNLPVKIIDRLLDKTVSSSRGAAEFRFPPGRCEEKPGANEGHCLIGGIRKLIARFENLVDLLMGVENDVRTVFENRTCLK
jgi:hypothetical protein